MHSLALREPSDREIPLSAVALGDAAVQGDILPALMEALPHRRAARIVVLDAQGRILLLRHAGSHGQSFWATPGGGLEEGETFEQAACREAAEELGVTSMSLRLLWDATNDFVHVDRPVRQEERYLLMEDAGQDLLTGVEEIHKREGILEARWWTPAELEATSDPVFPKDLATQLGRISVLVSPSREPARGR